MQSMRGYFRVGSGFFYNPDNVYKILLSVKSVSTTTEKQTSRDYLAKDITLAVKQVEQALEFMFL